MRPYFFLIVILFTAQVSSAQHTPPGKPIAASSLNSTQWLQDIDFLQKEIMRLHPDPFYKNKDLDKQKFDNLFGELRKNISFWDENKIVTEITRIIGLMNDGHSAIDQFANPGTFYNFKFFPLFLYYFPEGLHVLGALPEYADLIGKKLVAIDGLAISEIIEKMRPIISKDYGSETSLKDGLRYFITISQYLCGLEIIKDPNEATFTFIDLAGIKTDAKLRAGSMQNLFAAFDRSGDDGKPLYRQGAMKFYWHKYLSESKSLYIRYNSELIDTTFRPAEFCKKMQETIDHNDVQKVILDLRQNQGGNIGTLKPIYDFLIQPKINQYGKLYVLIDRRSQSAATIMAIRLSMISKAILIGEPTVSAVNFFDNDRKLALPNSKLRVGISTHFQSGGFPNDDRVAFEADIPMEITAKDYFSRKDPILDFALKYKPSPVAKISTGVADPGAEGKYHYSALQVIHISKEGTAWKMVIDDGRNIDFLNTNLYPISREAFLSDIKDLKVFYKDNEIILQTKRGEMKFKKLPFGHKGPFQLIEEKEIDYAAVEIKRIYSTLINKIELKELESNINSWGYMLINNKDFTNAIKIFAINVELFPTSFNVWDSLGEAYALAGEKNNSIRCYQKALELEPGLISATRALQKLR